jgi:hypothetical protein
MTLPNVADPNADYGMPDGGFADYLKSPTDPTTDWTSGNPPDTTGTGGPGGNQLIVDVAGMTRTARRCWARFVAGTSPTIATHDANWGNDSGVKPLVAHGSTGVFTLTWPTTITDKLGVIRSVNLRYPERPNVEGAVLYFAQATMTSPTLMTVYVFNSAGAANDATGVTIFVAAG